MASNRTLILIVAFAAAAGIATSVAVPWPAGEECCAVEAASAAPIPVSTTMRFADGHRDEIDVLAWSWGFENPAPGTAGHGTGQGAGKVTMQDMNFTKFVDKSSADLMLACANGTHIDEAVLTVRKAGGDPVEYYVIRMKKVLITSVSPGGSGEEPLTENYTLNFEEVKVEYKEQGPGGAVIVEEFGWDGKRNKPQ